MGTAHEDLMTFISNCILLRIRYVSDKSCKDNHNIHFMVKFFFFSKIMPVWDDVEEYGTARQVPNDNIIQCMKDVIKYQTTKTRIHHTHTHTHTH